MFPIALTPRQRAAVITVVLVWQGLLLVPRPRHVDEAMMRRPAVRAEVGRWSELLGTDAEVLSGALVTGSKRISDVQEAMLTPLGPFMWLTETDQRWTLFGAPHPRPWRLEIHGRSDEGPWVPLYIAGVPESQELARHLHWWRLRDIYSPVLSRPPRWGEFVTWVSARMFERTDVDEVRVRMTRANVPMPGENRPPRTGVRFSQTRHR